MDRSKRIMRWGPLFHGTNYRVRERSEAQARLSANWRGCCKLAAPIAKHAARRAIQCWLPTGKEESFEHATRTLEGGHPLRPGPHSRLPVPGRAARGAQ